MDAAQQIQADLSGLAVCVRVLSEINDLPGLLQANRAFQQALDKDVWTDERQRARMQLVETFGTAALPFWKEARRFAEESGWVRLQIAEGGER